MKLARFQLGSEVRWGIVDVDAATVQPVVGSILDWGPALTQGTATPTPDGAPVALDAVKLLAPIELTSKVLAAGMNYMKHLERLGHTERPKTTKCFIKTRTAVVDPGQEIRYPLITDNCLDYEIELIAVGGNPEVRSTADLLGYTIGNDVSARDYVGDLFSMKSNDQSSPVGPWIATLDEFGGPGQPDIEFHLTVNGEERQRDRTTNMIWTVDELIAFVTARTGISTGDVLFTGTTCGVGMEDGRYLQPGDVVEATIDGIGSLRNTVGPRP